MSDNVVDLKIASRIPLPASKIIALASDAGLKTAVVMGWDSNGEFWFKSTTPDGGDVLWLMEICRKRLMEIGD